MEQKVKASPRLAPLPPETTPELKDDFEAIAKNLGFIPNSPYNREDLVESERLLWLSIDVPQSRKALIDYDDAAGGGQRNLTKRWWFDLEIVGREVVKPQATNERDLDLSRTEKLAKTQKLAFFPPELQPAGGTTLQTKVPIDRAAGLAAYAAAESPLRARQRKH